MNIKIQKIIESSSSHPVVEFTSEFGVASALWRGKKIAEGEQTDVELTIGDIAGIRMCDASQGYRLHQDPGSGFILVSGSVEEVDVENKVIVMRIGEDIVQMEVDTHGINSGSWAEVSCKKLSLYEVSY